MTPVGEAWMNDRFAIEELLAPIEGPDGLTGAGPDVRGGGGSGSGLYLAIKDARNEARLAERNAITSGDPDAVPLLAGIRAWETVAQGGTALLAETKDLQVAAWLTEAWLRSDGFPGVAAGFDLLAGLVERFWNEGLHPQEDEDGVETRVAPLFGLFGNGDVGTLLQPIKLLPLSDHEHPAVALWTVETVQAQSTRHEDPDLAEELVERRRAQITAMEDAIHRASPDFAGQAAAGIAAALAALDRLMGVIDAHTPFGRFGSQVSRPLEDAAALLRVHGPGNDLGEVEAAAVEEPVVVAPTGAEGEAIPVAAPPPAPEPMNRERALATLLEVAAFFDRNEPQSIVGESLRHVVRRANLTAVELLAELLPDGEQRALFLLRAGIGRGADGGNDDNGY
ncbi:type VI secretion system protein TssA [Sphingomonas cynarae]|uniref:Type VI secretion system protein TssA n=2 Tax=Sphingomonas cynarae TaxID=930197 RepID=A0ABP7E8J2_9SPHN